MNSPPVSGVQEILTPRGRLDLIPPDAASEPAETAAVKAMDRGEAPIAFSDSELWGTR
jgi:hypothetical protein